MKITKTQLKQIIKEEIDRVMSEASGPVPPQVVNSPDHDVVTLGTEIHYLHSGFSATRVPQNIRRMAEMVARLMWETDYNPEEHKQGGKGASSRGVYDHAKDYKIIKNALGRGPKSPYSGKRLGYDILDPSESHLYNKYMENNPGMKGPKGGYSVWPTFTLIEPSNGDRVVFFSLGPDRDDTMMARGPA